MADLKWPDIRMPDYDNSTEKREDVSIHSQMEDGVHTGRRKWTKARKTFKLSFSGMSDADYMTMMDFIDNTVYGGALPFSWTCPWDKKQYTVYITDSGEWTPSVGTWSGSLTFVEAF